MSTSASSSSIPNLVGHTIDDGRLYLLDILGRGGFGVVYLAATTDKVSSQHLYYAVKCIRWNFSEQCDLPDEISLHKVCSSASSAVLKIHNVIEDEARNLLYIVMDYCPDGDLLDMIVSGLYAGNDELVKSVFIQILDAVMACHETRITHRDLKPENILCKDGGRRVVLADFGFASTERSSKLFGLGSEQYMSPEVSGGFGGQLARYSTRLADIWALGVILMNLTCASLPWAKACLTDPNFLQYVTCDPDYLLHSFPISRELNEILKSIFTVDPRQRTSIPELRERIRSTRYFGAAGDTAFREISSAYIDDTLSDSDDSEDSYEEINLMSVHIENAKLTVRNGYASGAEEEETVVTHSIHLATNTPSRRRRAAPSNSTTIIPHAVIMPRAVVSGASGTCANAKDADSDDESQGPITPEQYAVDVGRVAVHLEDVPDFPEAGGLGADVWAPVHMDEPTPFKVFVRKAVLEEDAPNAIDVKFVDALAENAGDSHSGSPARNILRNAARRMGIFLRNNK